MRRIALSHTSPARTPLAARQVHTPIYSINAQTKGTFEYKALPYEENAMVHKIRDRVAEFRDKNQKNLDELTDADYIEMVPKVSRVFYGSNLAPALRSVWSVSDQVSDEKSSLGLKVAKFFATTSLVPKTSFMIFTRIKEHVEDDRLYEAFGLTEPFAAEFFLWTLHMWLVFRRLQFEGQLGQKVMKELSTAFWKHSYHQLESVGVATGHLTKRSKELEEVFYGVMTNLDQSLNVPENTDGLMASALWRNLYGDGVQVSAQQLELLVKYLKFHICYFENVSSKMMTNGVFQFFFPDDPLFQDESEQ